jgi:hypothetical protein
MRVTFQSRRYAPDDVRSRYVRRQAPGLYAFCEGGDDRRFDLRQGYVDAAEIPEAVRKAADARAGYWPSYVSWPR